MTELIKTFRVTYRSKAEGSVATREETLVKANSLKEAQDSAYWMLHTKTNPPVKANYKYKIKGNFYGLSKSN